jgi:hypothetical protein
MQKEASYDMSGKKLFIGLPAYDFKVCVKLAIGLANFGALAAQHGINVKMANISGCSIVSRARNLIAHEFLESDAEHLLMIDSDISFEAPDILRLMAWNQNKPIVAGMYVTRSKEKVFFTTLDHDEKGAVTFDEMGCVKAKRVGTGFMMVHRKVFETLREQHPEWKCFDQNHKGEIYTFFDFKCTPDGYIGEDYLFCDRAHEAGFTAWIDPTIKLGHIGVHEFDADFGKDYLYPRLKPVTEDEAA